ncbi:C-terminal binding protein [Thermodesulfobacteriota bacterium]
MGFKVQAILEPWRIPDGFPEKIQALGAEFGVKDCKTEDERIAAARDADFIITGLRPYPFTRRVIEGLEKTKFVETLGIGYEGADLKAATEHGIGILHHRGMCDDELSDHAMALILACSRWILGLHSRVKMGNPVPAASTEAFQHMSILRDKTLGIIGLGRTGGALVPKAKGFGMRVLAYDPYVDESSCEKVGVKKVGFDRLLEEADFISIHTTLNSETRHFIGLDEFKKMKNSAFVINVARGPLINEPDLYKALSEGYIAGAGLDVTDPEPPPKDSPLLKYDNVIVTGHNAGASAESNYRMWSLPIEQVARVIRGEWPIYVVNPEVKERYIAKWGNVTRSYP